MRRRCPRLSMRVAPWALLLSLTVCTPSKPPRDALFYDDSAVLVPTNQLSTPSFTVVQRVRGKSGTQDVAFECVVQLAQGKLTVTGTTPYSARAFTIEQAGVDVELQGLVQRDVPFEPVQVLYDIHRVFFRGLPAPQTDGTHELLDHGEVVRELWQDGHLLERRFHVLETFARLLVIEFNGAPAPVIAPRVRLTNLHYGYALEIENVDQRRLDKGYSLQVDKALAR